MYLPERFYQANDWLCFVVGCFLNATLVWLINNCSEGDSRSFSPILLFSTTLNLVYLASIAVVVPVILGDVGHTAIISLGPLRWLPQPYNFVLVVTWNSMFGLSLMSQWVPFLYRYMMICRGKKYGLKQFLAIFSLAVAVVLYFVGLMFHVGYTGTEKDQRVAWEFLFGGSNESSANVTTSYSDIVVGYFADGPNAVAIPISSTIAVIMGYTIVFVCAWAIWRHLKHIYAGKSLIPLALENLPIILVNALASSTGGPDNYGVYATALFSWEPVLSPLVTMWVIRAYRQQVGKWLGKFAASTNKVAPLAASQPGAVGTSTAQENLHTPATEAKTHGNQSEGKGGEAGQKS